MTNFASKIAGVATLALAALPMAALSTAARAQEARPTVTVRIADLNLASIDGLTTFHQRVSVAAQRFCAEEQSLDRSYACRAGVHAEMKQKLAALTPATQLARAN